MNSCELTTEERVTLVYGLLTDEIHKISSVVSVMLSLVKYEMIIYTPLLKNRDKFEGITVNYEEMHLKMHVLKQLHGLFSKHMDTSKNICNYRDLTEDIDKVIENSIRLEHYEIAEICNQWRRKLPDPKR